MLKPKKKSKAKASPKKKSFLRLKSIPKSQSRPKKGVKPKAKARPAVKAEPNPFRAIAIAAARAADDKKAIDVSVLDLGKTSDVADFVVIAGAESSAQMGAIESQIEEDLRELGQRPIRRDGSSRDRRWIAVDYGNLLVHILMPQAREKYRLDQLWETAKRVKWLKPA